MAKGKQITLPFLGYRARFDNPNAVERAYRHDGKVYVPDHVWIMDYSSLEEVEKVIQEAKDKLDADFEPLSFEIEDGDRDYSGPEAYIKGWREANEKELAYIEKAQQKMKAEKEKQEEKKIKEAQSLLKAKGLL